MLLLPAAFLSYVGLSTLVDCSPVRSRSLYAVKDSHHVPRKWTRVGDAPPDHVVNLEIALKQSQFDELERHLYEVSDPDHDRYGNHLEFDEVNHLVKPSGASLDLLHEWLRDHGIGEGKLSYSPAKDWVKVSLPVVDVEALLATKYSVYKHADGTHVVRAPTWSLPTHLHKHIDTVQPTNSFFRAAPKKSNVMPVASDAQDMSQLAAVQRIKATNPSPDLTVAQACNVSAVTPLCLRTLYGTVNYKPKVPGKNKVGLTNYLGETNNRSDVYLFLQQFRPEASQAAFQFEIQVIANGDNQQTPNNITQLAAGKDLEGNLDAETILGIDYPTPLIAYNTGGSPPFKPDENTPTNTNEPYLTWVRYVLAQRDLPQIISTSYGDDEQTVPEAYARRVCNEFAQLGARGVSLLFASGDDGVGGAGTCFTNDGKNTSTFLPSFPDGCPFVTSVGATKNFNPEVVAFDPRNGFVSGGGFSNYFRRPSYQDNAVKPYVASLGDQFKGLYNKRGRGYPDIAAQGQLFQTVWNGTIRRLDGTSASTPAAAAILSLVNDSLLAAGRKPLGFLNPWLYKRGYQSFTDVLSGSATGCGTSGFPAVKGWDAVTGFGTPYFPKVRAAALNASQAASSGGVVNDGTT
ncbi:MAG: hypothetical protein L6R40_000336 [Gallowayella cf. fulva]|nr:MAG: hypothetical protein L6R40_000336 [Xanthomendoza cf. fulva]